MVSKQPQASADPAWSADAAGSPPPYTGSGRSDEAAPVSTLLDSVLATGVGSVPPGRDEATSGRLAEFLGSRSVGEALRCWFGTDAWPARDTLLRYLTADIGTIDALLERQLNAILHHPDFQRLESSYRGLEYLVRCQATVGGPASVKIKVLNWGWRDLVRDLDRATEFDQSQLFRKVYENEFGTAGGEPFGVLIGDYQIRPRPSAEHGTDDLAALRGVAQIAASAFCPFIAGAHPSLFGLNRFDELERVENLERGFDQPEFLKWRAFRDSEDARFVGLVLPRVLMRLPYERTETSPPGFCFGEDVSAPDQAGYLWGNAAFALGEVLIRSFVNYGWFSEIRGVSRNAETGGIVTQLPVHSFATDQPGVAPKSSTDFNITEFLESHLAGLGFIALSHCYDTEYSAFYATPSVQKPRTYDRDDATQNARISAMLQYMFCVSRFAHYLKVIARDKIGSFSEAEQTARELHNWLMKYVTPDETASIEIKARRPLRDAEVDVRPEPGKPGQYLCTFRLLPHYQFDNMNASIQLRTRVAARGNP